MRFSLIAAFKSVGRAIRRRRFIHLRRLAAIRRETRAVLDAAAWDDDTIRHRVDKLEREHSALAIAFGRHGLDFDEHLKDAADMAELVAEITRGFDARLRAIEQRLGVAEPVEFDLDLSAIAKG